MKRFVLILMFVFALALGFANAQERVGVGYGLVSDGNCAVGQHTLVATYDRPGDTLAARGQVRSEPAGGDCRQAALSYDVFVARYFQAPGAGVDLVIEFGAAEQNAAAPYALIDANGNILLRPDGNALFSPNLPAGAAQTIIGSLGVSKKLGDTRLGVGANLVPIDWATGRSSRTVHITGEWSRGGFLADGSFDIGSDSFGEARGGYRHDVDEHFDVGVGLTFRWGIAAIDNGAPLHQTIAGTRFVRAGPPRDTALMFEVTLGYRLD